MKWQWNDVVMLFVMLGFDVFSLVASLIESSTFFSFLVLANLILIWAFCYLAEKVSEKTYENLPQ